MKSKIYIKILLCVAVLLLVGCKKKRPDVYDNSSSNALLDALEAIEKNQDDKALKAVQEIPSYENDSFKEELVLIIRKRQQMKTIDSYLKKGDFQSLRLYLEDCQKSGDASSELLALRTLPDDLQALTIFCSKMPWESSDALQDAMNAIGSYLPTLSQYESFRKFYAEQQATLVMLQRKERFQRLQKDIKDLDLIVASGKSDDGLAEKLELPKYVGFIEAGYFGKMEDPDVFAIALADCWKRLSPELRQQAVKALDSDTLCAKLVQTFYADTQEQYERFLCLYRDYGISMNAELARSYARTLPHPADSSVAVPGYNDIISCISQTINKKESK